MFASLVTIQNYCFSFSFKRILCFLGISFIFLLRSCREWRWEMSDSGGTRMTTHLYKRHYPLPPPPGISKAAINWLFISSAISDCFLLKLCVTSDNWPLFFLSIWDFSVFFSQMLPKREVVTFLYFTQTSLGGACLQQEICYHGCQGVINSLHWGAVILKRINFILELSVQMRIQPWIPTRNCCCCLAVSVEIHGSQTLNSLKLPGKLSIWHLIHKEFSGLVKIRRLLKLKQ